MGDLDELFERLKRSGFRSRFRLGPHERKQLREKGLATILHHGEGFVDQRLAPASPARDGRQTPWRGHPVFIAQHATATCCRSCLSKWHGIEKDRALSQRQRDYVLRVLERWLRDQEAGPMDSAEARDQQQPTLFEMPPGGPACSSGRPGENPSAY